MAAQSTFAARLKWWRERRGLSQLDLANAAEVSQRHVSFLEVDRTAPSREMVLKLANALDLSLRQQNALLLAAGFAPVWRESALGAPALAAVNRALDFMLEQQEPYAAFVVDRRWNLLRANRGGRNMVAFLTGTAPQVSGSADPVNLADALVAPDALRPLIVNWREVALYFLRGVRADALADGTEETAALLARLLAYADVPRLSDIPAIDDMPEPVLAIHFRKGDTDFKVFTTLATLGPAQDVTVQEIRIESFFPAEEATAALFGSWAGGGA
jgi:transcriptional regulator with XRE-family HTH domain